MIGRSISLVAAMGFVTGCMTMPGAEKPISSAASETPATQELSGLGQIADAALPGKSCGMILWTLEGSQPTAVLRYISGDKAEINVNGQTVYLTRASSDGASGFGVSERQRFESGDGLSMTVTARFGLGFNGGAYLEQGLIKLANSAGWSLITPAAGIAGCRN